MAATTLCRTISEKSLWIATLWIATAMLTAAPARADIYTWRDAEGVIHFSNQEAPDQAEIYMTEPEPDPTAHQPDAVTESLEETQDREADRRRAQTETMLEEANRRLDRALEKVDQLTDQVAQSREQATAAAEAARQAAIDAQSQVSAASTDAQPREKVIVYAAPYPYTHKRHGIKKHGRFYNDYGKKPYSRYYKPDRIGRHRYEHKKHHRYKELYRYKKDRYRSRQHIRPNAHRTIQAAKPLKSHRLYNQRGRTHRIR